MPLLPMVNLSLLKNLVPLASLLPTDRAELAKHCRVGAYTPGQIVFSRGDSAQTVPYLLSGVVEILDGHNTRVVRAETPDALQPLAQGARRATTATCVKPAQILLVNREHLDLVLTWAQTGGVEVVDISGKSDADDDSNDWMTALLQNQAFHLIPPGNIAQLFSCMQSDFFPAGKTIIRQGNAGDAYFIITEGRVQVVREEADGINETEISQLSVGRGFGEEALLSGNPRNASVRALTDVKVMRIGGHDFERLLKAPLLREIALDEVDARIQLVDVRLPDEYKAGHLPDAISLPLSRLRELAVQLDPARVCAVYCDSGRRSASATYLLCERGFDARLVVGGVDAGLLTAIF
ncbi:MAG: cyclic nucleotide-binding domain-containing protein [Pseudomonadota bacterium]|nr:cyclic nucleotide-binding domain-containing protein [Pseudomonadota bacterium]